MVWGELESESAEGSGDEARGQTDETEETLIPPRVVMDYNHSDLFTV